MRQDRDLTLLEHNTVFDPNDFSITKVNLVAITTLGVKADPKPISHMHIKFGGQGIMDLHVVAPQQYLRQVRFATI